MDGNPGACLCEWRIALSSCNYLAGDNGPFRDRADDYMEAPVLPLMAIPDELDIAWSTIFSCRVENKCDACQRFLFEFL